MGIALSSAKRFDEALEQFTNAGAITELADLAATALANDKKEIAEKGLRLCAVLTVQQSHWGSIREYLNNGNLPRATKAAQKSLAPLLLEKKVDFDCLLASCCARSDSLTKLDSSEQKPISKFLRGLDRANDWQARLSVQELGGAIERSQRYVDAVDFYEAALSAAKNDGQKRFAIARWVKSKGRLEIVYRGDKQYRRADEIKEEIAKVKATHQIRIDELAVEYPELDSLTVLLGRELKHPGLSMGDIPPNQEQKSAVSAEQPSLSSTPVPRTSIQIPPPIRPDVDLMLGQLKLRFSRENQRINLEHQTTSKTATIRLSPIRYTSEDVAWIATGGVYECEEWGLQVDSSKLYIRA